MPRALLANNAASTLSAAITDPAATSFTVVSTTGFPGVTTAAGTYFYCTLIDGALIPEIVKVTDITGLTLTCTRQQDGTTGRTFTNGAIVSLRAVSAVFAELASIAGTETLTNKTLTGTLETKVAVAASNMDLATANLFAKTIAAATTFTLSNVPASGKVACFILDLSNGAAFTITWWAGIKWPGGVAPTLTAAGRDMLGFITHDGGTTWTGLLLGKALA